MFNAVYRAVSHVSALTVMSTKLAPGESPKITGIRDQRLTACLVAILVGKTAIRQLNMIPLGELQHGREATGGAKSQL